MGNVHLECLTHCRRSVFLGFLKATNENSGVSVSDVCKNDDVQRARN